LAAAAITAPLLAALQIGLGAIASGLKVAAQT
jgi:hypothetical protein